MYRKLKVLVRQRDKNCTKHETLSAGITFRFFANLLL